jgi:hypothetical protein
MLPSEGESTYGPNEQDSEPQPGIPLGLVYGLRNSHRQYDGEQGESDQANLS